MGTPGIVLMKGRRSTGNYQTLSDQWYERQDIPYQKTGNQDYTIEKGSHILTLEVCDILSVLIKNEAQQWV